MKISDSEKLILFMLVDLQKALKVEGEIDAEFVENAIHSDNSWGLSWKYSGVFQENETPKDVTEVADALDMWSFIEESVSRLTPAEQAKAKESGPTQFPGYDGNNETRQMSIARFLTGPLERFSGIGNRGSQNSHSPKVVKYRKMVATFEKIRPNLDGRLMTLAEIQEVLATN